MSQLIYADIPDEPGRNTTEDEANSKVQGHSDGTTVIASENQKDGNVGEDQSNKGSSAQEKGDTRDGRHVRAYSKARNSPSGRGGPANRYRRRYTYSYNPEMQYFPVVLPDIYQFSPHTLQSQAGHPGRKQRFGWIPGQGRPNIRYNSHQGYYESLGVENGWIPEQVNYNGKYNRYWRCNGIWKRGSCWIPVESNYNRGYNESIRRCESREDWIPALNNYNRKYNKNQRQKGSNWPNFREKRGWYFRHNDNRRNNYERAPERKENTPIRKLKDCFECCCCCSNCCNIERCSKQQPKDPQMLDRENKKSRQSYGRNYRQHNTFRDNYKHEESYYDGGKHKVFKARKG